MSRLSRTRPERALWRDRVGRIVAVAAMILLGNGFALAQAPNSIDSVTVSKAASGRTVVRFVLKAPLANPPAGFAINNPPRIALDFPDTTGEKRFYRLRLVMQ